MSKTITIRPTTSADFAAVDALLARSYPVLLKPDYPPSLMVTAVPIISRARPELVSCGTYFMADDGYGRALAAGGWTRSARRRETAEIRHVVTDPACVRRGIGRALFDVIFRTADAAGITGYNCLATFTAVPFYRAMGFVEVGPVTIPLAEGITFPAVRMVRTA